LVEEVLAFRAFYAGGLHADVTSGSEVQHSAVNVSAAIALMWGKIARILFTEQY
jgi:hypothetical protein